MRNSLTWLLAGFTLLAVNPSTGFADGTPATECIKTGEDGDREYLKNICDQEVIISWCFGGQVKSGTLPTPQCRRNSSYGSSYGDTAILEPGSQIDTPAPGVGGSGFYTQWGACLSADTIAVQVVSTDNNGYPEEFGCADDGQKKGSVKADPSDSLWDIEPRQTTDNTPDNLWDIEPRQTTDNTSGNLWDVEPRQTTVDWQDAGGDDLGKEIHDWTVAENKRIAREEADRQRIARAKEAKRQRIARAKEAKRERIARAEEADRQLARAEEADRQRTRANRFLDMANQFASQLGAQFPPPNRSSGASGVLAGSSGSSSNSSCPAFDRFEREMDRIKREGNSAGNNPGVRTGQAYCHAKETYMIGAWATKKCGDTSSVAEYERQLSEMTGEWYDNCDVSHLRYTGYQ